MKFVVDAMLGKVAVWLRLTGYDTLYSATLDDDDYISIVGRGKDMVITGGFNVYPKEIELLIDEFDGVIESAVIGVPHPDFGEAVTAVATRDPSNTACTEENIIASLKPKLANFKIPKRIVFVDALPRNTMGKVQKNLLRETYADLFSKIACRCLIGD